MAANDPGYEMRLMGLGSEALVRAMRFGDWDIIDGAFFDNFRKDRHVIKPFTIPEGWMKFRAGDWGSAKPFAFGWFAVATDTTTINGVTIPRGALVMYREWYGVSVDKDRRFVPDKGVKMTANEVGRGVVERDQDDKIAYGVLDPAAFSEDGGPSIAERMANEGAYFDRADNARVSQRGAMGGWDQLRGRLNGDEGGRPMLFFFDTCIHTLRTLPALQHDEDRPEDLDTTAEDHAADMVRYGCMSRPWTPANDNDKKPKEPKDWFEKATDDDDDDVNWKVA